MEDQKEIIQSLTDAGCSQKCIQNFLIHKDKGEFKKAEWELEKYRKELLNEIHEDQRKLDCLDFLWWNMKKEKML